MISDPCNHKAWAALGVITCQMQEAWALYPIERLRDEGDWLAHERKLLERAREVFEHLSSYEWRGRIVECPDGSVVMFLPMAALEWRAPGMIM